MSTQSAKEWALAKYDDIESHGRKFSGVSPNLNPTKPPKWFDRQLFDEAIRLTYWHYFSLIWGQFIGLLMVLRHPEGVVPLVVTGNSSSIPKLFRRYLSTMVHVKNFMERDPFQPNSESFKSLCRVRAMHRHVARRMNELSGNVEGQSDFMWISQRGMGGAQFSFIGFTVLYPEACGLYLNRRQMESLIHFWRVIGYCLGTDDRFNICQGNYEQTYELFSLIFREKWLPMMTKQLPWSPDGIKMAKAISTSMGAINTVTYPTVLCYWEQVIGAPLLEENDKLTKHDRYTVKFIEFVFKKLFRWKIFHLIVSSLVRMQLALLSWMRSSNEKKLMEVHQDELSYGDSCPFQVKFEYRDVFEKSVPFSS